MNRRTWQVALLAAAVAAAVWVLTRGGGPGSAPQTHGSSSPVRRTARQPRSRPPAAAGDVARPAGPEGFERLAASLRGTEVDGALTTDENGHFLATPDVRRFFDYFLTTVGEVPMAQIRARIVAEIRARLSPQAAEEAIAFLDRYLEYRRRTREIAEAGGVPADLEERLDRLHALRREMFGERDAEALFGEEERMQRADLERRKVLQDRSLTMEEKLARLDEIEQQLPPSVREARRESMLALRLAEAEQALRQAGGTDDEVRALRVQMVGEEAADRLEKLDRQRALWRRRVEEYRRERDAIRQDPALDEAEKRRLIEQLEQERFSPPERLRLRAIELQARAASTPPPAAR